MMQTIQLGKTGVEVTALGVGTWAWGDSIFWDYGKGYNDADVLGAFQTSLECGVTFFDTAEIYGLGESERLLGRFMAQTSQPVQIASKYFPLPWRWHRSAIAEALGASLERLQSSQMCLYQIHWPLEFLLNTKDFMEVLAAEVKKGRIQAVGVSNYSAQQMAIAYEYLAERGIPLASNQVPYSLITRQIEENGVRAKAEELGVTILAYSPLAQGLLTGKYTLQNGDRPQGARQLDPRFRAQGLKNLLPVLDAVAIMAVKYDKTSAQIALNWLVAQGALPIPGAKNSKQARENAGALGWSLTADDVNYLGKISQTYTKANR